MRKQAYWLLAVFFAALFSTFSVIASAHSQDLTPSVNLAKNANVAALVFINLSLEQHTELEKQFIQADTLFINPNAHLWFTRLHKPLTLLKIFYAQNIDTRYRIQQNINAAFNYKVQCYKRRTLLKLSDFDPPYFSFFQM